MSIHSFSPFYFHADSYAFQLTFCQIILANIVVVISNMKHAGSQHQQSMIIFLCLFIISSYAYINGYVYLLLTKVWINIFPSCRFSRLFWRSAHITRWRRWEVNSISGNLLLITSTDSISERSERMRSANNRVINCWMAYDITWKTCWIIGLSSRFNYDHQYHTIASVYNTIFSSVMDSMVCMQAWVRAEEVDREIIWMEWR